MKKRMFGVIIVMAVLVLVGVSWDKPTKKENVQDENVYELKDKSWSWHIDGEFKYPSTYKRSKLWIDDVPAFVEVFSGGKIQLCFWPLLGAWSTQIDFPEEGVWLSPTEKVKNITYRADSKGIASGYTQNGNIYYLKQKMMPGADVVHSKVLVLIYPPSEQKKVSSLINIVKDW